MFPFLLTYCTCDINHVYANVLGEVAFVEATNERFKEYMPGRRLLR